MSRGVGRAVVAGLVVAGCGAAGASGGTFDTAYPLERAPAACVQSLDRDAYTRCMSGDGDGCARAVRPIENDLVVPEGMRLVFPGVHQERVDCIAAVSARGCRLGSARACMTLASARIESGDGAKANGAWLAACDRGIADGCWFASDVGVGRAATASPWRAPASDQRLLAERACDLGSSGACSALADLYLFGERHPRNPITAAELARSRGGDLARGYGYWERACLAVAMDRGVICQELRQTLAMPSAPRRGPDDLLPLIAEGGGSPSSNEGGGGGICEIDPTVCPRAQAAPVPPGFVRPSAADGERLMTAHRAACNGGDLRSCWRGVELEILRFTHSVASELRNQASGPGFDLGAATRDLCARGVADACLALTSPYLASYPPSWSPTRATGGMAEYVRACDLGQPLGCARAGHALRAAGNVQNQASMFLGRACQGGVAWACPLR